ncbi:Xaa-Pro peptidase family protein [Jeotgalicoccus sp. ATCC 8456]|uniref:M24 family metallopeptidase n=1 Tax=Jeotgalicoccus sp. ATCC 8456 TaxID=946435 RepID=UPI0018E5FC17|nr:Xaa-Pro peptidase family protein [Jeotgalicoccus sp. ATCC 8456]QQD85337.1 aminopeptidase P family protein [Jeotgalicoccus sp. ATCC 8456]
MILKIPTEEFRQRQKEFIKRFQNQGSDCAIIFSVTDIFYLTGFHFHATERPMGLIVDPSEKYHLFVPSLEHEHTEQYSVIDEVHSYPEYPGLRHPMEYFKDVLKEYKFENKNIGYDSIGYGSPNGYRGPSVDTLITAKSFISISTIIEEMRFIKSDNEIELIKESCRWGNLAHKLLQKYTEAGKEEIEVTNRASIDATMAMTQTLGPGYKPHGKTAYAIYRGQIGAESAFPHAVTQNAVFKTGDTLVTGAAADVFGYHSELERVMFVGEYNNDQEKYFKYMYDAQEVAFNAIKPGEKYSTVEEAVQKYYKETGITDLAKHHTGHNIGLLGHEAPFFDLGDDTIMEPGMVVTVEPGIYVKGLGGFRHSDTVLITETGMEMLTYYPRDIDSLIC